MICWLFRSMLFSPLQFSSVIQSCLIPYDSMYCSMTDFPVQHQPPEVTQTHVHRLNNAKHSFHPLSSLLLLPSFSLFNGSALRIRWPKYWSFSFSISPSNEYSGLISFKIDWFELLAVQGTLKSLLQHHSSKALILPRSAFSIVQLSHPYITTGKIIALTRQTLLTM